MKEGKFDALAKELNVSVIDVECLAKAVAAGIKKGGAKDYYLSASEHDQTEFALAWGASAVKKMERFVTTCLTSNEARETVRALVLAKLKEKKELL